jgi:uncharacterized protein YecT (DUF1311 family)
VSDEPVGKRSRAPLTAQRRAWLEHLAAACERATRETPDAGDPYLKTLRRDLDELRARLTAQLDSTERDT